MSTTFTDDDIGKRVETSGGETVGLVVSVDRTTAYLEADPGAIDSIGAALGVESPTDDTVPLELETVTEITPDAVRLEENPSMSGTIEGMAADGRAETDHRTDDASGESDESDERHSSTESAPPDGERTVTDARGRDEDRRE